LLRLEHFADVLDVVEVRLVMHQAARLHRVDAVRELRLVFVALHAKEDASQDEGSEEPQLGGLAAIVRGGLVRKHDRQAGANQYEGIEGPDPLDQVHVLRMRPAVGGGAIPKHDVRADEGGEEHDFGREEEPEAELAVGNRQRRLVLELDMPVAVLAFVVLGGMCVGHMQGLRSVVRDS
jgi:hypothetical protein